jgi:hypothetical protein
MAVTPETVHGHLMLLHEGPRDTEEAPPSAGR